MDTLAPFAEFLDTDALSLSCRAALEAGQPCISDYTRCLKAMDEALKQAFEAGVSTAGLLQGRSLALDRILGAAWRQFGLCDSAAALVAVGGYGRGEMHPGSDIDLLLLLGEPRDETAKAALEETLGRFLTFLWDIGLHVGHSVRNIEEALELATRDITVITNLMEARALVDPQGLLEHLQALAAPEHIWDARAFFEAKLKERERRYRKFGDTAYKVEPNLKDGPGGLRDIQMIGWVTQRHFGTSALYELVDHGFLTEREYEALTEGQDFLWEVRYALHLLVGRKEDRLLFDYQRDLANRFGYTDANHTLAVEQFMQRYYRTVMELERLNEILLQFFQEALIYADEAALITPINREFQARGGFLETVHNQVFLRHPPALLEVFLILQTHPELKGIRASAIRLIRSHCHLIDEAFRRDPRCRHLFMEILRSPRGVTGQLRRMNRYGILAAYIPAFGQIVGRMQYDLFHAYTVDEHTLFVVRNLRRFSVQSHAHEFPTCSRVFKELPKPELLYLAGLFHDIAKGRGGDHSELGAEDARRFCLAHGLSRADAQLVAWLVRNHLLMSMTAQRRDISDPEVVYEFATQIGTRNRLNHLYLLTVADIRGTNPNLWNAWKDALLSELYNATQRLLRRGLDNPLEKEELINEVKQEAQDRLAHSGIEAGRAQAIWNAFGDDYFLRHSADEVAWHTHSIAQAAAEDMPLVMIRRYTSRGSTELFVYSIDFPQLFALTTEVLDQLALNIVDARVITTRNGHALNTFLILEEDGKAIEDDYRLEEIPATVKQRLEQPYKRPPLHKRHLPRQLKHFSVPTRIHFSEDPEQRWTLMELSTGDRPGLLSRVGKALNECGVRVHNARIATLSERADDVFHITDMQHRPIADPRRREEIRQAIETALKRD